MTFRKHLYWYSIYLRVLANYMVWHLIKPLVHLLSQPFRDAHDAFMMVEKGSQPSPPSPTECVAKSESLFGFATGMLYVKDRGGNQAKDEVRITQPRSVNRDVSFISILRCVRTTGLGLHLDWIWIWTGFGKSTSVNASGLDMDWILDWIRIRLLEVDWERFRIGLNQMWTQSDWIWTGESADCYGEIGVCCVWFVQNAERSHRMHFTQSSELDQFNVRERNQ